MPLFCIKCLRNAKWQITYILIKCIFSYQFLYLIFDVLDKQVFVIRNETHFDVYVSTLDCRLIDF